MFFSILLAGLNSSREKMVIKRVESFPIKYPPHPPLILGVGGGVALGGLGRDGCPTLCFGGYSDGWSLSHAGVGFPCYLLWVGMKSFGVQGEVEHGDPCSLLPHPVGGLGTGQKWGVSWVVKVRMRDLGM